MSANFINAAIVTLLQKKVVVAEAVAKALARKQKLIMPTAGRSLQLLLLAAASY
jgi:hypothetical protein